MNAQVSILQGTYNLVYFPHELYPYLLQPIIRTLIPPAQDPDTSSHPAEPGGSILDSLTPSQQHRFLNISITPIECSVVCPAAWAAAVFRPAIARLPASLAADVHVSADTYMVLCVTAAGLDPAGRVMELSSPLALAGIPIFFLTTYYSDFILAPARERPRVIDALTSRGFNLLDDNRFVFNQHAAAAAATASDPTGRRHVRFAAESTADADTAAAAAELQRRTFELLKKRDVSPSADHTLELVLAGGRDVAQLPDAFAAYAPPGRHFSRSASSPSPRRRPATWGDGVDPRLFNCIVSALVSEPRFLSVTLAEEDPPSVLLDRGLLPLFGESVVGDFATLLTPIFLNLENLPSEVTGVVSGVAGRLVHEMRARSMLEMSYLSTARASAVVLPKEQAERALKILDACMEQAELVP